MKKVILLFDFGHGTRHYTAGKRSPDQTLIEGEWNREVGRMIVKEMQLLGVDCRILVPEDQDIPLRERCNRANKIVKDNPNAQCYFISIHIDAGPENNWSNASGWTVYTYNGGASPESKRLALTLYSTAKKFKLQGNRKIPEEGYWQANYAVLRETNCPAVLTENLFMTNRKECEFLKSKEGKETITNLHVTGLCEFLGIPYALATT